MIHQPVRGTKDLWGKEVSLHRMIVETALASAQAFGYQEIVTPIFETAPVFLRSLGESSDVVSKEMYLMDDRNGEQLALRPEGTAPVMRAVLSNNLYQSLPFKCVYAGPMFRYERPQKGRQRQFHQIGVECIGAEDPAADVEVIALAFHMLTQMGVMETSTLHLSSLGDEETRQVYRERLVAFLMQHREDLSTESQNRLEKNPLRILDSKDEKDQEIVRQAPKIIDALSSEAKLFFQRVQGGLDRLSIPYKIDPLIVRGLDYYCHTAFEFVSTALGAQSTVLGGGRYDRLSRDLGGPSLPSVGWAAGVERIALITSCEPSAPRPVAMVPMGEEYMSQAEQITFSLRQKGILTLLDWSGNAGKRLKRAAKANAAVALILGEEEAKTQTVTLRNMDSGEQSSVFLDDLIERLQMLEIKG